jgi:peptidylprolyl isomerase domain and WD repeat-containing protein 1
METSSSGENAELCAVHVHRSHARSRGRKKTLTGVEFVKQFRAHLAPITGVSASTNGFLLATVSTDQSLKIYDVVDFGALAVCARASGGADGRRAGSDMVHMVKLPFVPRQVAWIHPAPSGKGLAAVSSKDSGDISIFKSDGSAEPVHVVKLHAAPVTLIKVRPRVALLDAWLFGGNTRL